MSAGFGQGFIGFLGFLGFWVSQVSWGLLVSVGFRGRICGIPRFPRIPGVSGVPGIPQHATCMPGMPGVLVGRGEARGSLVDRGARLGCHEEYVD